MLCKDQACLLMNIKHGQHSKVSSTCTEQSWPCLQHWPGAVRLLWVSIRQLVCAQGMDTHSNILYVQENFPALSHLAHRTAASDKYRPETFCIIGNYYSLKAQHEKVGTAGVLLADGVA